MTDVELGIKIGKIEASCTAMDELHLLMAPLSRELIDIACTMDIDNVPMEGRSIELPRDEWRNQYEAGINRCVGFDILWM